MTRSKASRGDSVWFFIIYSIFSALFFFTLGTVFKTFTDVVSFSEMFATDYLILLINIFVLNLISSVLSWILTFFTLKYVKRYVFETEMKSYGDLSKGVNKFPLLSLSSIISLLLSSFLFTIGFIAILESSLFGANNILSLVLTYLIIKIGVHVITIIIIESKF
ncbi:MAG: hypothetical protein ACFFAS_18575 [Promethearchaeota archaeon]